MSTTEVKIAQLTYYPSIRSAEHSNDHVQILADDIAKRGIQKPLIVRPVGDLYQVICGLARWKGAIIAGLEVVPVDIRFLTDEEAASLSIEDNFG